MNCLNEGNGRLRKNAFGKFIISVISIIILLFSLAGCSKNMSATYYNQCDRGECLQLKSDGTFYINKDATSASGKSTIGRYQINGEEIIFAATITLPPVTTETGVYGQEIKIVNPSGVEFKGKISDNAITDYNGIVWVKE